jgi:hypothetical protein
MTEQHSQQQHGHHIGDPGWQYGDEAEGYVKVWFGTGETDFQYMSEEDVAAAYVDANIVNATVQPTTLLEIIHEPFNVYYANGATYQLTLAQIADTPYMGRRFVELSSGLIGVGLDDLTPLFNPYTTPGLAFIKARFLEEMQERAAELLEMAELVNAFAKIIAEYSQLENPAQALIRELMRPAGAQ